MTSAARLATIQAVGANVAWGLMPLYFLALRPTPPEAILVMQVVMTYVVLSVFRRSHNDPKQKTSLADQAKESLVPALLIATNWLIYLFAMLSGNAVDAGLGYFFTPFIIIILSGALLGERLALQQAIGTAICIIAVLGYTIASGVTPLYGIGLALSFGCYAVWHRFRRVPNSVSALHGELTLIAPVALVSLIALAIVDRTISFSTWGMLALLGPLTALPLYLFVTACRGPISAVTLASCQFIAPLVSIAIGIFLMGQSLTPALGMLILSLLIGGTIALVPITGLKRSAR